MAEVSGFRFKRRHTSDAGRLLTLLPLTQEINVKITKISVYQVDLPLCEGNYNWASGKSVNVFDSTVVKIETDSELEGYGEVCPLGPVYLPSYAAGARAGIAEIAPNLIGEDPTELAVLNDNMDTWLKGHPLCQVRHRHGLLGSSG